MNWVKNVIWALDVGLLRSVIVTTDRMAKSGAWKGKVALNSASIIASSSTGTLAQ